jgi:diadenosine tetraphosphate (Ap4A) HIT family hydrolase
MDFQILREPSFTIEHSPACLVPGYLMITPNIPTPSFRQLPGPARRELGRILECASMAIKLTIAPVRLHCSHFGDDAVPLRYHLFPRTAKVTCDFLGAFPHQEDLMLRPLLLHWARSRYRAPAPVVWEAVAPVLPALRDAFLLAARARSPLT